MARLKKGSNIRKSTGLEEIATQQYLNSLSNQLLDKSDYPSSVKSFIPRLEAVNTPGNHTYTKRWGEYIEFAGIVIFNLQIMLSKKDTAMNGNTFITGLPYTSKHTTGVVLAKPKGTITDGYEQLSATIGKKQNRIWFYKNSPRTGSNYSSIPSSAISSDFEIVVFGVYLKE